jgi:hypothetical protein
MKKIFNPKAKALLIFICIPSVMLVAFQNFTPHVSKKPSDVSDLYMNSALSTALKIKEEKKSQDTDVASHREIAWDDDPEHRQEATDREPASNEPQSTEE